MSNYSSLKATINANVKQNGNQEITGAIMNSVLNAMVDSLGAGYQYKGVATPATNPGTPDYNVFYLASEAGTYTNFGGLVIGDNEVAALVYNGSWSKQTTGAATAAEVSQLGQKQDKLVSGGNLSKLVYDHSEFAAATVTLPSTITLSQEGDFVEMKVKGTDSNSIIRNTAAYNIPQIYYSGNTTLAMRLIGVSGVSFSYSGTGVSRGTVQVIKLVLSSISGTTRNFTLYIDGVERTPATPITADADVTFAYAGNNTTMDLYYIKGKSEGVEFTFDRFADYTVSAGTVQDVNTTVSQHIEGLAADEEAIAQLQSDLSDVAEDVEDLNGKTDSILSSGGSASTFDNSTFSSGAYVPVTLSLSSVGDSVEVKVKATNDGYILYDSTAGYNNPRVCFPSSNTLQVRLSQTDNFTFQDASVVRGTTQTVKVALTDITSGVYTFTMYLDGVKVGTATTSASVTFDRIGNNVTMDLYFVKYTASGVTTTFTGFSEMTGASGTITDNYVTSTYDGIVTLTERVDELENEIGSFLGEDMLYQYHKTSSFYYCDHDFCIFQRLEGNTYLMTVLGYYNPTGNEYPKGYWRLERSRLVTIEDGEITTVQDSVLVAGENEFVLKWLAGASYNADGGFTGGYHRGESVEVTGAWVEFIIDGNVVTPSDDIPLTACQSFLYREYTPIYNCNDSPATVAAWHLKETEMKDGGYETTNDVKFIQALDYFAYPGIVCVSRWLSEYAMPEGVATITDMGDGSPTIAEQFKSNGHRIHYEGNGYMCDVESEVLIGADDAQCQRVVYNSSAYNKFYRRNPDTAGSISNRLKGRTKVKISAM